MCLVKEKNMICKKNYLKKSRFENEVQIFIFITWFLQKKYGNKIGYQSDLRELMRLCVHRDICTASLIPMSHLESIFFSVFVLYNKYIK